MGLGLNLKDFVMLLGISERGYRYWSSEEKEIGVPNAPEVLDRLAFNLRENYKDGEVVLSKSLRSWAIQEIRSFSDQAELPEVCTLDELGHRVGVLEEQSHKQYQDAVSQTAAVRELAESNETRLTNLAHLPAAVQALSEQYDSVYQHLSERFERVEVATLSTRQDLELRVDRQEAVQAKLSNTLALQGVRLDQYDASIRTLEKEQSALQYGHVFVEAANSQLSDDIQQLKSWQVNSESAQRRFEGRLAQLSESENTLFSTQSAQGECLNQLGVSFTQLAEEITVVRSMCASVEANNIKLSEDVEQLRVQHVNTGSSGVFNKASELLNPLTVFLRLGVKSAIGVPALALLISIFVHRELVLHQSADVQQLVAIVAVTLSILVIGVIEPLRFHRLIMSYLGSRRSAN